MAYATAAQRRQAPPPEYLGRKGEGRMDDDEFQAVVANALQQGVQYVDEELSPDRAEATRYYLGKTAGIVNEEGRSQVILTEVRDAVDGMLPSFLRVFFGSEHAVEFAPNKAETVEMAAQMTDYVRYVFEEDNSGFLRTLAVLKDGLIRKIGIFKWGWDDSDATKAFRQEGLSKQDRDLLVAQDDVQPTRVVERKLKGGAIVYDVDFTRTTPDGGRAWVREVPPEEFGWNRSARSLEEATLLFHRTEKTRGQLLAMGIKAADLDEHGQLSDEQLRNNDEEIARRDAAGTGRSLTSGFSTDAETGKANDKILYTEALMTVDWDGDGIAELRQICCIGNGYYPVKNIPTDEKNFAIFTPYPEPHALLGGSVADRTMDVQKINSALLRAMLDSLSASIFPRTVYLEQQASVADIMNTAIGAPIRERVAGAVRTLEMPFVGKEAMPILTFMQEVIERRTSRNKGVAGLDADALQSTGKEAVGAVLTGSQEQLEMICRIFAEMTLKPLFRGLARLLVNRQPKARVVRLRGQWVEIDPRQWDVSLDVTVNVALGATFTDKKVATLLAVAADQKELAMATGGLSSPVVPLPKILNTRAKVLSLQGIKDFANYYTPLPPDWQPPPAPPPPPDPELMWAQAEKEMSHTKAMKELAIKADELEFEREKFAIETELKIREMETDKELKRLEIEAKYAFEANQREMDRTIDVEVKETELTMAAQQQHHDQRMQEDKQAHEKRMAEHHAEMMDRKSMMESKDE